VKAAVKRVSYYLSFVGFYNRDRDRLLDVAVVKHYWPHTTTIDYDRGEYLKLKVNVSDIALYKGLVLQPEQEIIWDKMICRLALDAFHFKKGGLGESSELTKEGFKSLEKERLKLLMAVNSDDPEMISDGRRRFARAFKAARILEIEKRRSL